MKSFLEILAHNILTQYGNQLSDVSIVFPSRRACVFFKRVLSEKIEKPIWSPGIMGVQDFIAVNSPWLVADNLELIFELYESYSVFVPEETFDRFYPWGNMMLNDFDEIDRSLVDAGQLFRVLIEHKKVEEQFSFDFAETGEFRRFWRSFSNRELTDQQKDFIKTWEIMGKVYDSFRKRLISRNICYEGMAYRKIYELARTNKLNTIHDKVIFAGFNQLNKAEIMIINELLRQKKAEIFWDADNYYLDNGIMEAGKFLRQNIAGFRTEKPQTFEDNLGESKKSIHIVGAPLRAGQAKALGYLLGKNITAGEAEKTAVVLPDESMLIPVLHSIPLNVEKLNITMGYPFSSSSLYNLINAVRKLHKNQKGSVYYYKDCIEVLSHPFVKIACTNSGNVQDAISEIKSRNIIYLSSTRILSMTGTEKIIELLFKTIGSSEELISYLHDLIELVFAALEERSPNAAKFEKEFFFAFYNKLNLVNKLLTKYSSPELQTLWKIIIEAISRTRIPFTGEPLKGLQVMGLLETRSLDFENVYILSMNEGTVPKGNSASSFIPYHLRRGAGLPTYEDDDAAFAYYFYRLIQRAKNIYLLYNTESNGLQSGEKSRFILQIENELSVRNKNIDVQNYTFQAGLEKQHDIDFVINKTDAMLKELMKRRYSASSLNQYINCSMKFYFSKVVGLEKDEEVEEAFSGAAFGSILHEIMSQLYSGCKGKVLNAEDIKRVKDRLAENFDSAWEKACEKINELSEFASDIHGKNLLFKNVIYKLAGLILENDLKHTPFSLIDLEGKIEGDFDSGKHSVMLTGRLDRVECSNGITRIIDYKTGSFKLKPQGKSSIADYFDKVFSDPEYKEGFQQYFYAMLYLRQNPGAKINIGIYPLRTVSEGISYYEPVDDYIRPGKLSVFEDKLKVLFEEILDPDVPFKKTADLERCKFCDFAAICYRE